MTQRRGPAGVLLCTHGVGCRWPRWQCPVHKPYSTTPQVSPLEMAKVFVSLFDSATRTRGPLLDSVCMECGYTVHKQGCSAFRDPNDWAVHDVPCTVDHQVQVVRFYVHKTLPATVFRKGDRFAWSSHGRVASEELWTHTLELAQDLAVRAARFG